MATQFTPVDDIWLVHLSPHLQKKKHLHDDQALSALRDFLVCLESPFVECFFRPSVGGTTGQSHTKGVEIIKPNDMDVKVK